MADCGVQFSEGQWCHRPAGHSGPHQDFLRRGTTSGAGSLHPSETFPPQGATSPNAIRRKFGLTESPPIVRYVGPKPWRAALAVYLRLWADRLESPRLLMFPAPAPAPARNELVVLCETEKMVREARETKGRAQRQGLAVVRFRMPTENFKMLAKVFRPRGVEASHLPNLLWGVPVEVDDTVSGLVADRRSVGA